MSWIVLDKLSESPTWEECYATHDTDSRCPDDKSVITDDSDEKLPVELKDEGCFSVPSPPNSSFPTPAPSSSPPHKALQTSSISQNQWRDIKATASHRYKVREHRGFRAPVFMQRRCGRCCCCCSCNCSQRRFRPWRYRAWRSRQSRPKQRRPKPTRCTPGTSWHLPVTIQPTKWYQVVGRMRCSLCYAQGWHYMTSWMCQSCQVPLCLLPYRNCYAEWHSGQKC